VTAPLVVPNTKPDHVPAPNERARMVAWFDPVQLLNTAIKLVTSTTFGRSSDRRILDAVIHSDIEPCDYSSREEVWIDYVSDTGDGWNSTYAIAHQLAQPILNLDWNGETFCTERAQVLILGGDEVYPTASRAEYEKRLVMPFRTALPYTVAPNPTVFAVPGNHDWYDSLVAFSRMFCSPRGRWFGGWQTRQTVSYFAIKLPHDWWLIGADVQLDSDIDDPQLEYFTKVAARMSDKARVILCLAEPQWIEEARYAKFEPTINTRNLDFLEEKIFEGRIVVYLAGDLHHYRRHAAPDNRQKITAGGGGAFLYPTHGDEHLVAKLKGEYTYRASFPSPRESRALAWNNLKFMGLNPTFGFATAILYLLLAWAVNANVGEYGITQVTRAVGAAVNGVVNSQIAVFWGVALLFGFYFFTDTHSPRYKFWGGGAHAVIHLITAFLLAWFASWLTVHFLGLPFRETLQLALAGVVIAVGGYLIGPLIMGVYLLISLNVFGRHAGEFSSLHNEDFKSWLRMRITRSGDLEIYPIGIPRVPKSWREPTAAERAQTPSLLVSQDGDATPPTLIEHPIKVPVTVRS